MAILGNAINFDQKNYITIQDEIEYRIAGIQSYGKGVVIRRTVKGSELTMKKYQVIKNNQLMWCKVDTKNGAFGITHDEHIGALASTNMALAEINEKYLPQFIETLFQLKPFYDWITKYSSGSTNRKYLTPKELMINVEIPNLSRPEQESFQEKVNFLKTCGLFSELTHQQTLLKKLRQQVLQEAIEGKLTTEWRKKNPDVEPASELLKRIQAEKAQLIKDKKIKKQKPLPTISEEEKPFDLPEGWVYARPNELTINEPYTLGIGPFGSDLLASDYRNSGVPLIFVKNITNNDFDLNIRYVSADKAKQLKAHIVKPGYIVITKMGDPPGTTTIYENKSNRDGILTADCIKFGINKFVSTRFVLFTIMSNIIQSQLGTLSKGMGRKKLSLKRFKTVLVPLPSINEQKAIVTKVEKLLTFCDQLETQITNNQSHAEQLMQAVLKEAFSQHNEPTEQIATHTQKAGTSAQPHLEPRTIS